MTCSTIIKTSWALAFLSKRSNIEKCVVLEQYTEVLKNRGKAIEMTISCLWERIETAGSETVFCVQQDFPPDGTFIVIFVKQSEKGYEIWSSAEHRVSGPYDSLVAIKDTLDDALRAVEAECCSWEEFFRDNSSGDYTKPKSRPKVD